MNQIWRKNKTREIKSDNAPQHNPKPTQPHRVIAGRRMVRGRLAAPKGAIKSHGGKMSEKDKTFTAHVHKTQLA